MKKVCGRGYILKQDLSICSHKTYFQQVWQPQSIYLKRYKRSYQQIDQFGYKKAYVDDDEEV